MIRPISDGSIGSEIMSSRKQVRRILNAARQKTADILGDDGMDTLKSIKNDLKNAGTNIMQVASEVTEDSDNEVLQNAREFYSGAISKTRKGIQAGINAAEKLSEDDPPKTVKEDFADSCDQIKSTIQEVAEDCDNEVLRNAREFYSGAYKATKNGIEKKAQRSREHREIRRAARADARRRRAAIRSKLFSKAGLVLICMILLAALLISGALWFGKFLNKDKNSDSEPESTAQSQTEPSLLVDGAEEYLQLTIPKSASSL